MPKQVFACNYCAEMFSTLDEAVRHEDGHYRPCANPSCNDKVYIENLEKRNYKKFCSRRCGNAAKQSAFRARKRIDFILN